MKKHIDPNRDSAIQAEIEGRNKSARLAQSGLTNRVKGHLRSSAQRAQAKRDNRQDEAT